AVAADRGRRRAWAWRGRAAAVPPCRVGGAPGHHPAVARPAVEGRVGDQLHGPGGVPLLAQDHDMLSLGGRRLDHVVDQAGRKAVVPVADLALLAVVDAASMLGGDPLAPAPEMETAVFEVFLARTVGVGTAIGEGRVAE